MPKLKPGDALLIIDVQNDFLPGGALAVPSGDQVIAPLKEAIQCFHETGLPIFASRDWHPADHQSFQEQGGPWPPHCVQGSDGAEFATALQLPADVTVLAKGCEAHLEGYSAFEATDFDERLKRAGINRLFVGGLATDYCVLQTVKKACSLGYAVYLLEEAVRAVNVEPDDGTQAIEEMVGMGTHLISGIS